VIGLINQDLYPAEFALHEKYAQSGTLLELVWTHCNAVTDLALSLYDSGKFDVAGLNRDYLTKACLFHDIGTYRCQGFEWIPDQPPQDKPYIQHVLIGAWILKNEGFDNFIVQTARNHTGVGLTAEDIQKYGLDLPVDNYIPRSLIEQIVSYASKHHSKAPKFKTVPEIIASLKRFDKQKVSRFNEFINYFGEVVVDPIKDKYEIWHKAFNYKVQALKENQMTVDLNSAGIATMSL